MASTLIFASSARMNLTRHGSSLFVLVHFVRRVLRNDELSQVLSYIYGVLIRIDSRSTIKNHAVTLP